MTCPKCGLEQSEASRECPRCGIVFQKYLDRVRTLTVCENPETKLQQQKIFGQATIWSRLKDLLLPVESQVNPFFFGGRAIVYIALVIWGMIFISKSLETNYTGRSFMHLINLPFHEAGHIIFSPFGRFMTVLGGTLMQLLIPLLCLGTFLAKQNPFAASVGMWWFGQSFMDIAPYINDARAGRLVLLGGVTGSEAPDFHDWHVILSSLGLLNQDHLIAHISSAVGILSLIAAFIWGGYILFRQFRNLDL
ncbi:MAG: zinc ribbon domain-containing protein [bacterium]